MGRALNAKGAMYMLGIITITIKNSIYYYY